MKLNEAIEVLKTYRKGDFVGDTNLCEAIDTVVNELEGEDIPEELNGASGRYVILMERLIDMQKEMDPEWFKAHALSIVLRAYNKGMDVAFNHFEKLKANLKSERRKADEV